MSEEAKLDKNQWRVLLAVCVVGAIYFFGILSIFVTKLITGTSGIGLITEIYLSNDAGDIISIQDPHGKIVKESTLLFPNFSFSPFQKNNEIAMICDNNSCLVNHPYVWQMELALLLLFTGGIFYCSKNMNNNQNKNYRTLAKILFWLSGISVLTSLTSLF